MSSSKSIKSGIPSPSLSAQTSIVTLTSKVSAHNPVEVIYRTVYVPAVEADRSIKPELASMVKPDGVAVKAPPVVPVIVGVGSDPIVQ